MDRQQITLFHSFIILTSIIIWIHLAVESVFGPDFEANSSTTDTTLKDSSTDTLPSGQTGEPTAGVLALIDIYNDAGKNFFEQGNYSLAIKAYQQALQEAEKACGKGSIHTAGSLAGLAEVYNSQREYHDVLRICERLIPMLEKHYPDQPDLIITWMKVKVRVLKKIGRYSEARELEYEISHY